MSRGSRPAHQVTRRRTLWFIPMVCTPKSRIRNHHIGNKQTASGKDDNLKHGAKWTRMIPLERGNNHSPRSRLVSSTSEKLGRGWPFCGRFHSGRKAILKLLKSHQKTLSQSIDNKFFDAKIPDPPPSETNSKRDGNRSLKTWLESI